MRVLSLHPNLNNILERTHFLSAIELSRVGTTFDIFFNFSNTYVVFREYKHGDSVNFGFQ